MDEDTANFYTEEYNITAGVEERLKDSRLRIRRLKAIVEKMP